MLGPAMSGGGAEGRFRRIAERVIEGNADVAVLVHTPSVHFQGRGQVIDLRWRGAFSYPRIIAKVARHIRQARYDVVMGFGMFPNLVAVMASRLSGTGARVVIHEITRPVKMLEQSPVLRRIFYENLQRWVLSHADVMTSNSIDGLSELQAICLGFDGPTQRLNNALDLAALRPRLDTAQPAPALIRQRYMVCVASLVHMKRLDTTIEAFKLISGKTNTNLVIVGDGSARPSLERLVEKYQLRDSVLFTGSLSNPLGIIRSAEALIMSSEYEGFSNSMLEAMILGTPVITSRCSADVLEIEQLGAVLGFPVGDSACLANHMANILEDDNLVTDLRTAAFSYVERHGVAQSIKGYDRVVFGALQISG